MAERDRDWAAGAREADAVSDLTGEPPDDACDEKQIVNGIAKAIKTPSFEGLSSPRARCARYYAQLAKLEREVETLEAKKKELNDIINSQVEATFAARNALKRTAAFLLGHLSSSAGVKMKTSPLRRPLLSIEWQLPS
jgi:hypothetical protein